MDLSKEKNITINVSENLDFLGKRLDFFLKNKFPEFSRTHFQKLLKKNNIKVNKNLVSNSYKLKKDDIIEVENIENNSDELDIKSENISLDIIYEDEDIVVINKPSNMVVHPACGNYTGTLVNALMFHFSNLPSLDKNFVRPGIVHRLDKETSGIMIIAKNELAMKSLAKQFETRKIKKEYLAICYKKSDLDEGKINIKITRSKLDRKKMALSFDNDINAKTSVTNFRVLEKYKDNIVLIKALPETGRTHQIRLHLSYVGYPIINDSVYGVKYKIFNQNFPNLLPRTLLHAKSISFFHPKSKKFLNMEAKIPNDFQKIISFYKNLNL